MIGFHMNPQITLSFSYPFPYSLLCPCLPSHSMFGPFIPIPVPHQVITVKLGALPRKTLSMILLIPVNNTLFL